MLQILSYVRQMTTDEKLFFERLLINREEIIQISKNTKAKIYEFSLFIYCVQVSEQSNNNKHIESN